MTVETAALLGAIVGSAATLLAIIVIDWLASRPQRLELDDTVLVRFDGRRIP